MLQDKITNTDVLLLKSRDLRQMLGVSDMWLWRHVKAGTLPPPILMGSRRFWLQHEIEAFLADRAAARGKAA